MKRPSFAIETLLSETSEHYQFVVISAEARRLATIFLPILFLALVALACEIGDVIDIPKISSECTPTPCPRCAPPLLPLPSSTMVQPLSVRANLVLK
jgi:hypothetical protein